MTNQDIQAKIDTSAELLNEAQNFFEVSKYDESEQCAREALSLIEPEAECDDLGEERDNTSQKFVLLGLIAHAYNRLNTISLSRGDYFLALKQAEIALKFCERNGNIFRKAYLLGNIGVVYSKLSDYKQALMYYQNALAIFEQHGNKHGMTINLSNLGIVYGQLSDNSNALTYLQKALAINEEIDSKDGIATNLGNIGNVYKGLSDNVNALTYHQKALAINEEIGSKVGIAINFGNCGNLYKELSDYSNALMFMQKALAINEEIGSKSGIAINLGSIGELYADIDFEGYNPEKAEEYLRRAIAINEEIGAVRNLYHYHKSLSELYKNEERWKECQTHFEIFYKLENEVQSEEAHKQANLIEQRRRAEEREKEFEIERTRATAEKKILNNILPEEITARLIKGENPIADHFDSVSVLFMDIVDFTTLASSITAQQLVHLLNAIFSAADGVMREFGLEKIKTIGDAYMAVAGAPIIQKDHTYRAALAALKLLEVMENLVVIFPENYGDKSWIESIPEIQVRIGLHCGPVAAGVVGENKFLYDLWGDAVNTASRMESHGEAGKIHVSEEFMNAIVGTGPGMSLRFAERGKMEIKGKGIMKTYFLEHL